MVTRNIVILPPPEVAREAIIWSRQVAAKYTTDFVLDGKEFYPHITLFQGEYPDGNIATLTEKLNHTAKLTAPFSVRGKVFVVFERFLFLEMHKDESIATLQHGIFSEAGKLGKKLSSVAGEIFLPHITITRFQQAGDAKKAVSLLPAAYIGFEVHSLFLANIGLDGSVNEIFKEFPLQMV
jgi:2'-5' RNA ligase